MDWSNATWWWVAAGALVAAELVTGTFYLLMLAIGTAAGALAAHAQMGFTGQLLVAAGLGGGAVVAWHLRQRGRPPALPANANRDVNLDIGSHVHVAAWGPEGTARVDYRGAGWDARFGGSGPPAPGEHVIVRIEGNRLVLIRPST